MRIDHLNIVVSDIERSARFYADVLGMRRGFEAMLEGDWIETVTGLAPVHARCVFMEAPGGDVRIELLQYLSPAGVPLAGASTPNTPGLRHLAFVVDDMDVLLVRLERAGVPVVSRPVTVPFAVGAMGEKRLFYFHDPDGVLLEIAAYG